MRTMRWGILSSANIGVEKVIPAMQRSSSGEITALASRDPEKARLVASKLGIPRSYGSYEDLLEDTDIDAVYNPLPNHLHVPWTIKAARAGKHVLCEKPIALDANEASSLLSVQHQTGVLIEEAFMVGHNPQWLWLREQIREGAIGRLAVVQCCFSYMNRDPENIRNIREYGGGGIYDIGCYPVFISRFLFGEEPDRATAIIENDPEYMVDRLASGMLEFPSGQSNFICGTQLVPYQRVQVYGTEKRIEVEIPFNAPNQMPCRVFVDEGRYTHSRFSTIHDFPVCDQYTLQGEAFERTILENRIDDSPIRDAIANMRVIDALYRSGASGSWEPV